MVRDFLNGFRALVQRLGDDWELQERRTLVRLRCEYKCLIAVDGKRTPAVITDLGEGGMGLRSGRALDLQQEVTIFCPFVDLEGPFSPQRARVRWIRPGPERSVYQVGLRYLEEGDDISVTWVEPVLQLLGFPGRAPTRRKWIRLECELPAQLGDRKATVYNLGVGGALVKIERTVACGSWALRLPKLGKAAGLTVTGDLVELPGREGSGWYALIFGELDPDTLQGLGAYLKAVLGQGLLAKSSPSPGS